ncbi:MAG: hypothetical protein AAF701_10370, partial [Pseudomonadota bacterium]
MVPKFWYFLCLTTLWSQSILAEPRVVPAFTMTTAETAPVPVGVGDLAAYYVKRSNWIDIFDMR